MNASQSGAKKSGGVFARLTNRKMSNYESQLKKKFGAKHSDSQSAFGQRKQSANIKQSAGPSMTFNQGKVNETIYSNRSHHNEKQPEAPDSLESPYIQPMASYSQEP